MRDWAPISEFHQVTGELLSPYTVRIDDSKLDRLSRLIINLAFGGVSIDDMRAMRAMFLVLARMDENENRMSTDVPIRPFMVFNVP